MVHCDFSVCKITVRYTKKKKSSEIEIRLFDVLYVCIFIVLTRLAVEFPDRFSIEKRERNL